MGKEIDKWIDRGNGLKKLVKTGWRKGRMEGRLGGRAGWLDGGFKGRVRDS